MKKNCSKCGKEFDCLSDEDITQCHCAKVVLTQQQVDFLKKNYSDCLCGDCLKEFIEINTLL